MVLQRSVLQNANKPNYSCEINLTKEHIINEFIIPYKSNKKLLCNGNVYESSELIGINFYFTPKKIELEKAHQSEVESFLYKEAENVPGSYLMR